MHGNVLVLDYEDNWIWKDSKDSRFTVKSAYDILRGPTKGASLVCFSVEDLCFTFSPIHYMESVAQFDCFLERCGVAIVSNLCCFLRVEVELTRQMSFECRVAWLVLNKFYDWMGLMSVVDNDPVSHF